MRLALTACAVLVLLGLVSAGGAAWWAEARLEAPGPAEALTIRIPPGSGMQAIAARLTETGHAPHPYLVALAARRLGLEQSLKAGEYALAPGASLHAVLDQIAAGRVVEHRLTVPEGLTAGEIAALIGSAPALDGPATTLPEASLLPETYEYLWGQTRAGLEARMKQAMDETLAELWAGRAEGLPLASPREALILASIVEKETGIAAERPLVAAVFVNRLKAGMRLQSDPTVIYALTLGKGRLDRPLTRADWQYESPWNTYRIAGLPPGPIATPGRDAIQAVLHPATSTALYFVADGTGGHAFADTLAEHNRNVARWKAEKSSR